PYAELIEGYDKNPEFYAEDYIDSLFTEAEANQLKAYLDREHGDDSVTTIEEVSFPVVNNIAGVGSMAVGGADDFYMLTKEPSYDLPFQAWGYFDLVDTEPADKTCPHCGGIIAKAKPAPVLPAFKLVASNDVELSF